MDHRLQQLLLRLDRAQHSLGANQWAIVPAHEPSDVWAAGDPAVNRFDSEAEALAEIPKLAEIFGTPEDFWTVIEGKE